MESRNAVEALPPIELAAIRAAAARLPAEATRTPLVPLELESAPEAIHLKLENLQPIGSFKLRGAWNALAVAPAAALARGVATASAGNMSQGLAWAARRRGLACRVLVPEGAPETKLAATRRLGAEILAVSFDEWWRALVERGHPALAGHFVHPVCDADVVAGHGTIGLELLEQLPEVRTVLVPFGGGGLVCGIASALEALRPEVRVLACEVETAAPLTASMAAGRPLAIEHRRSFVDGIGGKSVLAEMWPRVRALVDGTVVVSLAEVAAAIRLLVTRHRVVAEGAGAAALAAALSGRAGPGPLVCVISGGNLDAAALATVLGGGIP